jgi:hypothetical protein
VVTGFHHDLLMSLPVLWSCCPHWILWYYHMILQHEPTGQSWVMGTEDRSEMSVMIAVTSKEKLYLKKLFCSC